MVLPLMWPIDVPKMHKKIGNFLPKDLLGAAGESWSDLMEDSSSLERLAAGTGAGSPILLFTASLK